MTPYRLTVDLIDILGSNPIGVAVRVYPEKAETRNYPSTEEGRANNYSKVLLATGVEQLSTVSGSVVFNLLPSVEIGSSYTLEVQGYRKTFYMPKRNTSWHAIQNDPSAYAARKRYIGWSAAQVPTGTEIQAGESFIADVLTIPATGTDGYLWFAIPSNLVQPTGAFFDGNTYSIFGAFINITESSNVYPGYIVYAINGSQQAAILGTGRRTLTLRYN